MLTSRVFPLVSTDPVLFSVKTACGSILWFSGISTAELLTYASQRFPSPSPNPCFVLAPLSHIRIGYLQQLLQRSETITNEQHWKRVNPIILKRLFGGPINYWEQSSYTFWTRPTYSLAGWTGVGHRFSTGRSVSITLATKNAFPNCGTQVAWRYECNGQVSLALGVLPRYPRDKIQQTSRSGTADRRLHTPVSHWQWSPTS
jgi:hypothetical protein